MSVGGTPSLNFIGDTVGDVAPHSMSEMRGIRFASGNSPTTGSISLSDFRNQVLTRRWPEQDKIQPSDIQANDQFGYSVSISSDGNTALVGMDNAAYIFTRSGTTWTELQKIQSSDIETYFRFGHAVSISSDGNTTIVGAPRESYRKASGGAAYIFTRSGTTWTEQQKIEAPDKQEYDQFGYSVSISSAGNTAIVGAPYEDSGGFEIGSAYIFTRSGTTWTRQQKIQASDKQAADYFGWSVSISSDGNTAIVGAVDEDPDGVNDAGSAYIFTRSGITWTEQQKIKALDKEASDFFGESVAISGDGNTALVGAIYDGTIGNERVGAAYIFTRSGTTWTEQQKIQASDKQAQDNFGYSVSISGDGNTALVATGGYGIRPAYIFTRSGTTWTEQDKIQASDQEAHDFFGRTAVSISSDGNTALVGASKEDTGGTDAGAAYIFETSYYI